MAYAVVGVGAFAVEVVTRDDDPVLIAIGAASLVFAGLWSVYPTMVVRRLADRQMKLAGLPTTVTITDDEITCASAACRTAWSWTAFNGVLTVPGFWMLRVNGVNAVALDQEDLSPDQLSEVRAFLAARGLVPTAYRVS